MRAAAITQRLSPGRTTTDSFAAGGCRRSSRAAGGPVPPGGRGIGSAVLGQPGVAMVGCALPALAEGQEGAGNGLGSAGLAVLAGLVGEGTGDASAAAGATRIPTPRAPATARRKMAGTAALAKLRAITPAVPGNAPASTERNARPSQTQTTHNAVAARVLTTVSAPARSIHAPGSRRPAAMERQSGYSMRIAMTSARTTTPTLVASFIYSPLPYVYLCLPSYRLEVMRSRLIRGSWGQDSIRGYRRKRGAGQYGAFRGVMSAAACD